jgi:hypothetical protein
MYTAQEACGWNSGKGRALGIYNLVVSALMFFGVVFVATYHTTRDQKPLPARICRIACGVGTAAVFSHMIVVIALFSVQENKGGEDGRLLGIYSLVVSILLFLALGFGGSYYVGLKRGIGVRGYGSIVETE